MPAFTARSAKKSISYHDLYNLSTADLLFDENRRSMPGIFLFRKGPRTNLFPCKNINKYGRRFEDQRCSCLTISLNMENKGYSGALGSFSMGGNGNFTGYLDASNSVAVNSIESS